MLAEVGQLSNSEVQRVSSSQDQLQVAAASQSRRQHGRQLRHDTVEFDRRGDRAAPEQLADAAAHDQASGDGP